MRSPRCTPRHALQKREAKLRGIVAGQDGALARALDHHRQARIDVGHKSTRALLSPTSAMRPARPSPVTTAWPEARRPGGRH